MEQITITRDEFDNALLLAAMEFGNEISKEVDSREPAMAITIASIPVIKKAGDKLFGEFEKTEKEGEEQ